MVRCTTVLGLVKPGLDSNGNYTDFSKIDLDLIVFLKIEISTMSLIFLHPDLYKHTVKKTLYSDLD